MDVSKLAKEMAEFCQQQAIKQKPSKYRALCRLVLLLFAGGPPTPDKKNFWNIS